MNETRLSRRGYNKNIGKNNNNSMKYFDLIVAGIAVQIAVLFGSCTRIQMNGMFSLLLIVIGDVCLAAGIDYFKSKKTKSRATKHRKK